MKVFSLLSPQGSPVTVVKLPKGHLSGANTLAVRRKLEQILSEQPGHLLLDLSELDFIDSMGLSTLLSVQRKCRAAGYQLKLSGLQEQPRQILGLTHLDVVFETYFCVEDALKVFP